MILWGKWLVNMGGWNIVVIVVNSGGIRHSLPPSLPPSSPPWRHREGGWHEYQYGQLLLSEHETTQHPSYQNMMPG